MTTLSPSSLFLSERSEERKREEGEYLKSKTKKNL
jgi:hypothetical protein